MHSSERAPLLIEGGITLRNSRIQAARIKIFPAPDSRKKTALILEQLGFNDVSAPQSCFFKDHYLECVFEWLHNP